MKQVSKKILLKREKRRLRKEIRLKEKEY